MPKTMLYMLIGVGAAVLVLILVLLMNAGRRPPSPGGAPPRAKPPEATERAPTTEDLAKLKDTVYRLIRERKLHEARARVDEYRLRFPGYDIEALSKLSQEIEAW